MTVALYDLVRDWCHANSQLFADKFFDLGRNGGGGALCESGGGARVPTAQLVCPQRQLETKGHGFGMDTMGTSSHQRILILQWGLLNSMSEVGRGPTEPDASFFYLHRQCRIKYI